MSLTLRELHAKDVIQTSTGENLGRIDDLVFEQAPAQIQSVILRGRRRLFGLLGRDDDLIIPWAEIESIGADVIMVKAEAAASAAKRRRVLTF